MTKLQMVYVTLNGRLGFDPKKVIRKTANGDTEVTEFCIACNPFVGGVTHANFYNVTVWPGRFEGIVKKLVKGSAVVATGILYIVEYKDKNGIARTANNINLHHLGFPVADTEEIIKSVKTLKKKLVHTWMITLKCQTQQLIVNLLGRVKSKMNL